MKELIDIQFRLNAPKGQTNNFGHYQYRSAEDILAAAKPLLKEYGCILLLSDEVKEIGSSFTLSTSNNGKSGSSSMNYAGTRIYVEAMATIINSAGEALSVKALAREEPIKAGMDAAQITGSASSYARKYALNGLFAIDNEKDPDATNHGQPSGYQQPKREEQKPATQTTGDDALDSMLNTAMQQIQEAKTRNDLKAIYDAYPSLQNMSPFKTALSTRKKMVN